MPSIPAKLDRLSFIGYYIECYGVAGLGDVCSQNKKYRKLDPLLP